MNISHDLRTPLTAISGYLQLLQGQDLPPDTRRYLEQIESRTESMKRLTEELFRYSVVVSEENLAREPVDLRRAVEEALLSFYGALEGRGLNPGAPAGNTGDPPAGPGGCEPGAGEHSHQRPEIQRRGFGSHFGGKRAADLFQRRARLDPVAAGRLFDRFYTVEAARNSTGLGLSIAKELTQRMGGEMGAELHNGRLTVWLEL